MCITFPFIKSFIFKKIHICFINKFLYISPPVNTKNSCMPTLNKHTWVSFFNICQVIQPRLLTNHTFMRTTPSLDKILCFIRFNLAKKKNFVNKILQFFYHFLIFFDKSLLFLLFIFLVDILFFDVYNIFNWNIQKQW